MLQLRGLYHEKVLGGISCSVAPSEIFLELCPAGLEYCSAVWCSAADSHVKLVDRAVRSGGFLAGGVLECNLAHRRFVAELCMLFKIRSNPMHLLSGALPLPYVQACITPGALVAHKYSFALPRCRTSQYRRSFVPFSVSLWNDLSDHVKVKR